MSRLFGWMGRFTGISAVVAAGGLALVLLGTWPEMAMGLAIYGGNTEPDLPSAAFPTTPVTSLLLLSLASFLLSMKWEQAAWVALPLSLAAIAVQVQFLLALLALT